jgi:hypothetical protein
VSSEGRKIISKDLNASTIDQLIELNSKFSTLIANHFQRDQGLQECLNVGLEVVNGFVG